MVARKLGNFIVSIDLDFKTGLRPVLYTVEDILKMSILFFVLLKLSNDLVVCLQGKDIIGIVEVRLYCTYLICCIGCFFIGYMKKTKVFIRLHMLNILLILIVKKIV